CPSPALTTLPMMHSSTHAGSIPARLTASATTSAPSCGAEKPSSEPRNLPVAVRTAPTMTASCRLGTNRYPRDDVGSEQRLKSFEDDDRRSRDLGGPGPGFGVDQ